MHPESGSRIAPNQPKIGKITVSSQVAYMMSSQHFFDVVLLLLSSLVTGPSLMLI